jgi:hypothetical protein
MNLELRKLGLEIIQEIPKTWDFLKLVDARLIQNPETFETVGAFLYNNKHIFNEYLRYRYELGKGSYKSWMVRWDEETKIYPLILLYS